MAAKPKPTQATPPTTEFTTLRDPIEGAYTVGMPKGWHNRTYLARVLNVATWVDTTVSPDGSVLIFIGDPNLPQYWDPAQSPPMLHHVARVNPKLRMEPYQPAENYLPGYVKRKFGKLPGFTVVSSGPDQELLRETLEKVRAKGMNLDMSVAKVKFRYTDNGKPMNALVLGANANGGAFWSVSVAGIATTGDPERYIDMANAMERTRKMNPQWQALQAQKHQQQMAQIADFGARLTAQHERSMDWIQQSAQRHQQRMQAIHARGDASTKSYNDRMASGDVQHRNFLNYINDENTVASSSGKTYQVDGSYQRYYMHKRNQTYLGGNTHMDIDQLRKLGLNPDDYEEVKVK
jgi:hypothetical protein